MSRCLDWPLRRHNAGYGVFSKEGHEVLAHRAMYEAFYGPIPNGMFVCHHCDNRLCINPEHLFLGTAEDNNRDMKAKGRWAHGSRCGRVRLTSTDVSMIRTLSRPYHRHYSYRAIGKRLGVSPATVRLAAIGKNWKECTTPPCQTSK